MLLRIRKNFLDKCEVLMSEKKKILFNYMGPAYSMKNASLVEMLHCFDLSENKTTPIMLNETNNTNVLKNTIH